MAVVARLHQAGGVHCSKSWVRRGIPTGHGPPKASRTGRRLKEFIHQQLIKPYITNKGYKWWLMIVLNRQWHGATVIRYCCGQYLNSSFFASNRGCESLLLVGHTQHTELDHGWCSKISSPNWGVWGWESLTVEDGSGRLRMVEDGLRWVADRERVYQHISILHQQLAWIRPTRSESISQRSRLPWTPKIKRSPPVTMVDGYGSI